MTRKSVLFFAFALFGVLMGCATNLNRYYPPVTDGGKMREYPWFKIQAPEGESWQQMLRSDDSIYFAKDTKNLMHTFLLTATPVQMRADWKSPEEFMAAIKKEKDLNASRVKILQNDFVLDKRFGEYCFRYYSKGIGNDAPYLKEGQSMIMEIHGYGMLHPTIPGLYLDVNYSERYLTTDVPIPELSEAGEKFIDNFQPRASATQ